MTYCVPPDVRRRWLQTYKGNAYRVLEAIAILAVEQEDADGWTAPLSRKAIGEIAGVLHGARLAEAFREIGPELILDVISPLSIRYRLRDPLCTTRSNMDRAAVSEAVGPSPAQVRSKSDHPQSGNGANGIGRSKLDRVSEDVQPPKESFILSSFLSESLDPKNNDLPDRTENDPDDSGRATASPPAPDSDDDAPGVTRLSLAAIQDLHAQGTYGADQVRVLYEAELRLPIRPQGTRDRQTANGTPYRRSDMIAWCEKVLNPRRMVNVHGNDEDRRSALVLAVWLRQYGSEQAFDITHPACRHAMGVLAALYGQGVEPDPDHLWQAFRWWKRERQLSTPQAATAVANMYVEYMDAHGLGNGVDKADHATNRQRYTQGKYADIVQS